VCRQQIEGLEELKQNREDLEDAFERAEGQQEVAFRNFQRAKARNSGPLMMVGLEHGRLAHNELARLASKLSKRVTTRR
jgi:hypothetical protein